VEVGQCFRQGVNFQACLPSMHRGSSHLGSLKLEKFDVGPHMTGISKQASRDDPTASCFGHRHFRRILRARITAELLEVVRLVYLCVLCHGSDVG
jgi:hypothetical protein